MTRSLFNRSSQEVTGEGIEVREEGGVADAKTVSWANRVRRVSRWVGAGAAAGCVTFGSLLMFRNNNMKDFSDLRDFTSAEHREDRCNTQAAFDAQVKMRKHFEAKGGVTEADAELMAPVVGLQPEEIEQLLSVELFPMDYDCHVSVASSQEVTTGLVLAASGTAALVGAGIASATRRK